jgi:hypothetical protein
MIMSPFVKFKLYPSQHGFVKSKSTAASLIIYVNTVCSQGQFDSIYFDFGQDFITE